MNTPSFCGVCKRRSELNRKEKFSEYTLWQCARCRGQFWTPMKNPGAEHYEKDERYAFRNLNPLKKPERNHREFLRDAVVPRQAQAKSKLLDIGMGTGNFLAAAVAAGYQGYGIDFDRDAIKAARASGLKNVFEMDVNGLRAKFGPNYFDIITMFEVLEHLDNPADFITNIKKLLTKDGYLAISVPYRLLPHYLKLADIPPRHLTRWNKIAMKIFLADNNFEVVRMKIIPVSIPYLITKFHFWFRNYTSFNLVQRAAGAAKGKPISPAVARRMSLLQTLARFKDYVLFGVPAMALYVYLWLIGRNGLGLYCIARITRP